MRIAVLGPLEVLTDDLVPVPVPGAKERLLLAALAAGAPGVVSTDSLAETLWDGDPPASARKSLQAHVVRLRSSLEPDRPKGSTGKYVVRRGAGYALVVDRDAIDTVRMADLAARGRAQLASGRPGEAARQLRLAVGLWRGEPYADWPEAPFAETERRRLAEVRAGAEAGLLEAELELGRHNDVVPELERLVAEEPLREDWWRLLMLALYRAGRQGDALAAGRRARALLAEELGAEPGPALRGMEAAILAQDPALEHTPGQAPPQPIGDAAHGACPYKGLAAYQPADALLFHGRRRLVANLVARLVDASVLVVSGSSGAGKSSAVRAGLVPALADGALPGSRAWRARIVTPGRAPVDALVELTGDPPPAGPVLLVCDQFEELWAPGVDPAERAAFLDAVLGLIDDGTVVRCVAVVRGDHVGRLAEHAAFAERLGGALVLVPAMTDDELRAVVREPPAAAGLTADTELVEAVVADVRGRPAALPLLSAALVGTWERRRGDRLTLAGYLEAGGVAGALARSAEDAYNALDEPGRELARRLLVRLADVDDGGALVRRSLPISELDLAGEGGDSRRLVVEAFVGRRLLSVDGDRLEVTHEALLTGWPRLARWLDDDAAGRAVRRHLDPAVREWVRRGEPDDELYRGARLGAALDWAATAADDVTPAERRFLDASRARAEAELDDARDRARREAAARHRTRRLAAGLAAVLVVALVAAVLAVRSQRAAERASAASERTSLVADANRLAALSTTVGTLDLSFLLAAQGFRLAETPETWDALLADLVQHRRAARVAPFTGYPLGANLGNGGRTLFIGAGLRILRWDVAAEEAPGTLVDLLAEGPWDGWSGANASPTDDRTVYVGAGESGPWIRMVDGGGDVELLPSGDLIPGSPIEVAFTPDGSRLDVLVAAPAGADGAASSWRHVQVDPAGGAPRDTGTVGTLPGADGELDADISEGTSVAVVWSSADTARASVVDLASGNQVSVAPPARDVAIVDYRALSSGAAVLWEDGAVHVVDRFGAVVQELGIHGAQVWDVAQAPDGSWAATVGAGGEVRVWDVDRATDRWSFRESLEGHGGDVFQVEIDPAGRRLVTVSRDNRVIVWDLGSDGGFGTSHPGIPGRWVAGAPAVVEPDRLVVAPTRPLTPDGQADPFAGPETAGVAATFIDPRTGEVVGQVEVGDTVGNRILGASVAVSRDRRWIAVTSGLATTVLDARTRQRVASITLPPDGELSADGAGLPAGVVCCAVWAPDGSRLLLGGWFQLAVVDTATWEVVDHVSLDRVPEVMAFDDGDRWLALGSQNSQDVVVLDLRTLAERHRVPLRVNDSVWAMSFSGDGKLLAAGGESGNLHVIDTGTWEAREPVSVRDDATVHLAWLPDDRTVLSAGMDGTVLLFDTKRALVRAPPLPAAVEAANGYAAVVSGPDGDLVLFDGDRVGMRYPMDPLVWLREACAVAGRDLTRAEWDRYLPGRSYRATCSDLG